MATMRHDRTSLWSDPRISADEILEGSKDEEAALFVPPLLLLGVYDRLAARA